jgi:hypothetical protein
VADSGLQAKLTRSEDIRRLLTTGESLFKHCGATEVQARRSKLCVAGQIMSIEANYWGDNQTKTTIVVHP